MTTKYVFFICPKHKTYVHFTLIFFLNKTRANYELNTTKLNNSKYKVNSQIKLICIQLHCNDRIDITYKLGYLSITVIATGCRNKTGHTERGTIVEWTDKNYLLQSNWTFYSECQHLPAAVSHNTSDFGAKTCENNTLCGFNT